MMKEVQGAGDGADGRADLGEVVGGVREAKEDEVIIDDILEIYIKKRIGFPKRTRTIRA